MHSSGHRGTRGKRDRSDIVKLDGPADVRAIFNRARHFDFGPPFAGDPWDDRPTLGPNVARFPSAIPAGQRGGLLHAPAKRFQFLRVVGLIDPLVGRKLGRDYSGLPTGCTRE